VEAPLLFAGKTGERFSPALRIVADERIEFVASAKDGTQAGRHDRPGMHCTLEDPLMHGRLTRNPVVILRIPFARIDVTDDECEISVGNRSGGSTIDDEAASRQFSRHDTEELNG